MRTAVVEGKATQDMSSLNDKVQPDGNLRSPPVPNGTIRAGSQALLNLGLTHFGIFSHFPLCHSRVGGNPGPYRVLWIPVFTGMTPKNEKVRKS